MDMSSLALAAFAGMIWRMLPHANSGGRIGRVVGIALATVNRWVRKLHVYLAACAPLNGTRRSNQSSLTWLLDLH